MKIVPLLIGLVLFTSLACGCIESSNETDTTSPVPTTGPAEEGEWAYAVVDTGQTTCYDNSAVITCAEQGDAFYGQDAQYDGLQPSYEDNGDGTVTDLNTGLMWQQVPTTDEFSWQEAVDYCDELIFAGYDDWRIPSLKELFSISDFSSGWPYLDTDYFNLASGEITKDEQFWSSNYYVGITVEGGENAAFGVNHVTGHIKAYAAGMPDGESETTSSEQSQPPPLGNTTDAPSGNPMEKYVRAVRGEAYGINEFADNGDGTIADNATGLMWSQDDSGVGMEWEDALSYAENSELAGYDDWRLPNVKELQSIVDYTRSPSATDVAHIGPAINSLFVCTPIVNEAGNDDYGYYWTSTSANFTSGQPYYYAWYVAFGMAVNGGGEDFHGAGGVRFDTKCEDGPLGEGGERYYNFVRLVRDDT